LKTTRRQKAARLTSKVAAECLESRLMLSASVVTYHNDNASDGQNTQETLLTPSNVNSTSFGKRFTASVDGNVYAQPLFVQGLTIAGGVHNVLFVATEHDSVYALDATNGNVLWQDNMLTAAVSGLPGATSITTVPDADLGGTDIHPEIGITSTPVIDPSTNTLYVTATTKEMVSGVAHYVQQLFALNDTSGAEKYRILNGQNTNLPETLGDTTFLNGVYANNSPIWVNGTGQGNDGQGHVFFNALRQLQRVALTLANNQLYIAWGSFNDQQPYHGWIAAFNPSTLALTGVLNTTPNGIEGALWMSGGKLSVDASGALYGMTGNGTFDGNNTGGTITGINSAGFPVSGDYGNSFIKITPDTVHNSPTNQNINGWGLQISDYFAPFNANALNIGDHDLGSGAPLVLPDAAGNAAHPHLLVGAGKKGTIYLLDRDNMGKFSVNASAENSTVVEEISMNALAGAVFSTPAYFNQQLYFAPQDVAAKSFSILNGTARIGKTPASTSQDAFGLHGATPSVSANGSTNGIIWVTDLASNDLRAYSATGFNTELYTSTQAANSRDALGTAEKFSVPTVANGLVYVGTTNSIVVYGLLNPPASTPASVSAASNPLPALSPAAPNNASPSVGSDSSTDVRSVVAGSDEQNSIPHVDWLFAAPIMNGSSPPAFAQLDSSQPVQKRSPQTPERDALPVSAIDNVFSNF